MMTPDDARMAVARIANEASDYEMAHVHEDALYEAFVREAAEGGNEVAREILKTKDLRFARLCA